MTHLTFDLSSGLELRIVSSCPALGSILGSMLGMEPIYKTKTQESKQARNKYHDKHEIP